MDDMYMLVAKRKGKERYFWFSDTKLENGKIDLRVDFTSHADVLFTIEEMGVIIYYILNPKQFVDNNEHLIELKNEFTEDAYHGVISAIMTMHNITVADFGRIYVMSITTGEATRLM